jgi:hypothetical protein
MKKSVLTTLLTVGPVAGTAVPAVVVATGKKPSSNGKSQQGSAGGAGEAAIPWDARGTGAGTPVGGIARALTPPGRN